jgi:hypothetical protein
MAIKVVSSQGLAEFNATGKTEDVPDLKAKESKGIQVADTGTKNVIEGNTLTPAKEPVEDEDGLEEEDKLLAEKARRKINRKHREMREAEEFAEAQYNERRLAEQKALKLEQELAELKARVAPPSAEDIEPDKSKFDDAEKYWNARIKWEADQAVKSDRKRQAEERREEAAQAKAAAFAARLNAADKENPGLKDTIESSDVLIPQDVLDYIVEAENGPKIARHLAENSEYVEGLRAMSPRAALAAIGKLETKLETKLEKPNGELSPRSQPVERSRAPEPIAPLTGSSTVIQKDPSKMSFKELKEYDRERRERRARH